ncbi:hypothetical protein Tco_0008036 [Tanacetum coccineum]
MFMTIQSSVKDKILATLTETSKVENALAEMLCKTNVVIDALRKKEPVKPRRVRVMAMTIRYGVRGMMLVAQSEAFKQENGMRRTVVMDEAHASRYSVHPGADKTYYNLGDMRMCYGWGICIKDLFKRSRVLWAKIRGSSLIGPELVEEMIDKVVLVKEKPKATRDLQKSYADKRRKPLEFEVGDQILDRIGPVAYRLRLLEEVIGVHDIFHVSNLKKCLGNANLHVPLNEIKIDKTLLFVEELVEIMDREVKSLKHSRIPLVKVRWNSKRGPEFTWEREDYMKSKYP